MYKLCLLSLCFAGTIAHAQLNMDLLSNLDYTPVLNDIWGYVDGDGTEYALVGMTTGVSIVSLEDPTQPREIQFIKGVQSTWRDLKTWGDFVYVTADQGQDGLLIIDLSTIPEDTAAYAFWKPDIAGKGVYQRAHNIWIDEFGLAYLAGSNIGGTVILDVKPDPWNPDFLVAMPLDYAHDVYARDSIVYTSEIYVGQMKMYDITDLDDIRTLGFVTTPFSFTHNAWPSDNSQFVFTTDERSNAYVGSYDVSDPANIKELDRFRPAATDGIGVIPHNVHVYNDYLIISYYTDGCVVVDASRPDNLIEVANYDTYPDMHGGFSGAWGAYPFLPSENILISDRQYGLFVLGPTYKRACYLEGDVRDMMSQQPISGVRVEILLEPGDDSEVLLPVNSDLMGEFKTGKAVAGTFTVRLSHPDYYPYEGEHVFVNGEVTALSIELERKAQFPVSGSVVKAVSGSAVPFANVAIQSEFHLYQTQADADGNFQIADVFEGSYRVYGGTWGTYGSHEVEVVGDFAGSIEVVDTYYDDFLFDYDWTVSGNSDLAQWIRGVPKSEILFGAFQCNPAEDVDGDFGGHAFVTGNTGGNAANDGVRNGTSMLSSALMDLSDYAEPVLVYTPWLCQRFIEQESFFVLVSNGTDTVTVDTILSTEIAGAWRVPVEISLPGLLDITSGMQVHFLATESPDVDNVVKAGVDLFVVYDAMASDTKDVRDIARLGIYPNPASGILRIDLSTSDAGAGEVRVTDLFGRTVLSAGTFSRDDTLDVSGLLPGVYVVQWMQDGVIAGVGKVVVE